MNIILLGSPGSGKGTQASLLTEKFGLYLLQTGELSRRLAKKDKRIGEIINSGKLIPQEEMTMYVLDFLHRQKPDLKNILFEGFPRFISQYEALENFLKSKGGGIDLVVSLDVGLKEAVRRISSRRTCSQCGRIYNLITNPAPNGVCQCGGKLTQRKDDNPEAIKTRFEYYKENTKELISYLDKQKKLVRVDGEREINVIFDEIASIIERGAQRQ